MSVLRLAPLVLIACGVGTFRSSLPVDSELGSLTSAEVCSLQEESSDYVASALSDKKLCRVVSQIAGQLAVAVDDGDYAAACEEAYETCLEDGGPAPVTCAERILPEACSSTVAEFEACQQEAVVLFRQASKQRCGPAADTPLAYSPDCQALQTACELGFL